MERTAKVPRIHKKLMTMFRVLSFDKQVILEAINLVFCEGCKRKIKSSLNLKLTFISVEEKKTVGMTMEQKTL